MQTSTSAGRARRAGTLAAFSVVPVFWFVPGFLFVIGALGSEGLAQDGVDPVRGIKSKVVADRLAAVEALRQSPDPLHEKLLLGALADRDREVVERAAMALSDRGSDAAVAQLVRVCTDGSILRLRRAAARTLGKISPVKATEELTKLTSGKHAARALEALAFVARESADSSTAAAIQRALRAKDRDQRLGAGRAICALPAGLADETLAELLKGSDAELAALALDAVSANPKSHFLPVLWNALRAPSVPDVLGRRLIAAGAACIATLERAGDSAQAAQQLQAFVELGAFIDRDAQARAMGLYTALDSVASADSVLARAARPLLIAGLSAGQENVRKAAIQGSLRRAIPEARPLVLALAVKDTEASVRLLSLREATRAFGAADPEVLALLIDRLSGDADASVREEAAVSLGATDLAGAAGPLTRALGDPSWTVATCAAVSLGKTRDVAALESLQGLLSHADWRLRASAVVGMTWLATQDCVPHLMRALGDGDPSVRRTAHVFLEQQLKAKLGEDRVAWEAWWKANSARARLVDPVAAKERRERYGYASQTAAVFEDMDVVVLESRGDHIQNLLGQLKIAHRLTQASKLAEAALHPGAIYVSNCTGEIEAKDVERIDWYVRAGGVLFGSCWSLTETIQRVHPGILRKLETNGDVLDNVVAFAVDPSSPYLKGAFGADAEPLYHLEGSHLIEVLEPELCEVLIDSPQALERWGGGNLAATFRSGHGVILDSANHFDLQGLEVALGLRTAEDRMEFAFDHMGMDYETWRRTQNEKYWDSALKASQNIFDFSALNIVTNFVRAKRLLDG